MLYIESQSTDPSYNLALEQYVFDTLSLDDEFFMLWQNRDSVIVGLHQNTAEEINRAFIEKCGIPVVRRLSGGGAVFHDLGNLNFSFITSKPDDNKLDFRFACQPIITALEELGIQAETSGRNDITVDGKKFSGNARYIRDGRLMHHGTILFDTDFSKLTNALCVSEDKYISKGIKSVRARVTNLRDYLLHDMPITEFWAFLHKSITDKQPMARYTLSAQDQASVEAIRQKRYASWDWNYGSSPDYSLQKRRNIPGFGTIQLSLQVEGGEIKAFASNGDYFGNRQGSDIGTALLHTKMEVNALRDALRNIRMEEYYAGLQLDDFIRLILE